MSELGRLAPTLVVVAGSVSFVAALQQAFRDVVLARAGAYQQSGFDTPDPPAFLQTNPPVVSRELRESPRWMVPGAESDMLVIGRRVFWTHYTDGAWSFTVLLRGERVNYLVYLNQTNVDLLDNWYGGVVRSVVERRLREEAVVVLYCLRHRLESGDLRSDSVNERGVMRALAITLVMAGLVRPDH